jgi:hypothetical protein
LSKTKGIFNEKLALDSHHRSRVPAGCVLARSGQDSVLKSRHCADGIRDKAISQSSNIGFFLIAGFIVYITVRGELPAYLCVIGFGSGCPAPNQTPNSIPSSTTSSTTSSTQTTSTITVPSSNLPTLPSLPNIGTSIGSPSTNPPLNVQTSIGVPCDAYGDTDPAACAAINSIDTYSGGSGYNDGNYGSYDPSNPGGDNGEGDYE